MGKRYRRSFSEYNHSTFRKNTFNNGMDEYISASKAVEARFAVLIFEAKYKPQNSFNGLIAYFSASDKTSSTWEVTFVVDPL